MKQKTLTTVTCIELVISVIFQVNVKKLFLKDLCELFFKVAIKWSSCLVIYTVAVSDAATVCGDSGRPRWRAPRARPPPPSENESRIPPKHTTRTLTPYFHTLQGFILGSTWRIYWDCLRKKGNKRCKILFYISFWNSLRDTLPFEAVMLSGRNVISFTD